MNVEGRPLRDRPVGQSQATLAQSACHAPGDYPQHPADVAQLGERLVANEKVAGSNPTVRLEPAEVGSPLPPSVGGMTATSGAQQCRRAEIAKRNRGYREAHKAERDRYRVALMKIAGAESGVWGRIAHEALRSDPARSSVEDERA